MEIMCQLCDNPHREISSDENDGVCYWDRREKERVFCDIVIRSFIECVNMMDTSMMISSHRIIDHIDD